MPVPCLFAGKPPYDGRVNPIAEVSPTNEQPRAASEQMDALRRTMQRLDRRDWWLWTTTITVMLLLVAGLFVLAFPAIRFPNLWPGTLTESRQLDIAVHGLLGLVLLFSVFVVYQQVLLKRLRRGLAEQFGTISALQTRTQVLEQLATVDSLTGLYNRRFANEHLPIELERAERMGYPLTALMLDLNGFKAINDEHGHAAGDLALIEFARNLRRCFRSSDVPARMGGDEFMVLLPECTSEDVPRALMHLRQIEIEYEGKRIPIRFAAGWAQHEHGETVERLLARADQELYTDKRTASADRQRRQAEMMLAQTQRMQAMGQLASGVTHDFNNLVTIIRGYSSILLDELPRDHPLHHKVWQMDRAAERACQLTQQLLSFARGSALKADRPTDLNGVLRDLEPILKAAMGSKIEFRLDASAPASVTRADPTQLQQIVLNLAVNAREAMPDGGRLEIRTELRHLDTGFVAAHPGSRAGPYVALIISDTGAGIPEHIRQRIFEPFFTTKNGNGTGLGLAIVYGIVKQVGGYIWVDSEVGCGSTFTVYFPRLQMAVAADQPRAAVAAA
jgi:diguanylate cyclase (GGDEF)-like protein